MNHDRIAQMDHEDRAAVDKHVAKKVAEALEGRERLQQDRDDLSEALQLCEGSRDAALMELAQVVEERDRLAAEIVACKSANDALAKALMPKLPEGAASDVQAPE